MNNFLIFIKKRLVICNSIDEKSPIRKIAITTNNLYKRYRFILYLTILKRQLFSQKI